jgi:hypothetical protein
MSKSSKRLNYLFCYHCCQAAPFKFGKSDCHFCYHSICIYNKWQRRSRIIRYKSKLVQICSFDLYSKQIDIVLHQFSLFIVQNKTFLLRHCIYVVVFLCYQYFYRQTRKCIFRAYKHFLTINKLVCL